MGMLAHSLPDNKKGSTQHSSHSITTIKHTDITLTK